MNNTSTTAISSSNIGKFKSRRKHQRGGLVSRLEDVTYAVLRGYQLLSGTTPSSNSTEAPTKSTLAIVARNEQVIRAMNHRQTWLVYRSDKSVRAIDVDHDYDGTPFVVGHAM